MDMDLDAVTEELYGLRPAEFTAARNTLAARARTAGDRELAARIAGLRKPSTAAWAAGLLPRQRPAETQRLLSLGAALREAHRTLDGVQLRQLSHDRHRVIGALARTAGGLAAAAGQEVSGTVLQEVEQILHAVLADEAVAAEWAAGRLAKRPETAMGFTGLEPAPGAAPSPPPSPPPRPARRERALRAAEEEQARARAEAEAEAEAERLESDLAAHEERLRSTREAVSAAERELRAAADRLDAARAAHAEAGARHEEASRTAARARTRARAAARKAAGPGGEED
ncbi:hypothetical protein [Streptomyces sp. NPDC048603]|uniref:hypothetical protein n=1 Tax=Streptomyces sp. NPDC048603 TaxID=3365577 RepID=UPI003716C247